MRFTLTQYIDGTIEWDHSSDGHFADKEEDPTWAGRRHE